MPSIFTPLKNAAALTREMDGGFLNGSEGSAKVGERSGAGRDLRDPFVWSVQNVILLNSQSINGL